MSARGPAVAVVVAGLALCPVDAGAHLFHKSWEPPETQRSRDTQVLQLLLDDPAERFDLARDVYEGRTRVRIKPGGFRRWLVRSNEPGMVFKADYQLNRWEGSLRSEAERIDAERSTRLADRIDTALRDRDREGVRAALREMYVVFLDELLAALWGRLDHPEAAERLHGLTLRYFSVNLEAYLNIHHPVAASVARASLDAMARTLGDAETGAPPSPEAFERQRRRFLRILSEAVPVP